MDPSLPPDQNLTEKQLSLGYWFVTHKLALRRYLTIFLVVVCSGLGLFVVGMLVKLFLIDYSSARRLERELAVSLVNPAALEATLPKPLLRKEVTVLEGGKGAVDVLTQVGNPNTRYWAEWTGQFIGTNTTTTPRKEYILPGETKTLVDLGIESPTRMRGSRYEITGLEWHKLDAHVIPDFARYAAERLRFAITGIRFETAPSPDGKSVVARVSFDAKNDSAYGYWTVRFLVNLYRGTTLAAANAVELQQLESGETRKVEVVWVQDLAAISKVEVIPQVNILDAKAFMPPRGR